MKLEGQGILISLRPFNERDAIAHIFSRDYGVLVGMIRGALVVRKNRPLVGQVGNVIWTARVDSQLGVFHWEADKNLIASFLSDPSRLTFVNSAFALIDTLLPERAQYDILYDETISLVHKLSGVDAQAVYLDWEVNLLRELGYALDLSTCAGCGRHDSLVYVSPRTGHAVCADCGAPWADKMYKLPISLTVTGQFLDAVCVAQGANMPLARRMVMSGQVL